MFSIHRIIHPPHIVVGDRSCQFAKRRSHLGMLLQHLVAHDSYRFVGRKIMMVVLQHHEVERRNQSIGIVAGNQINLPVFERTSNQSQIHDARRRREAQAVTGDQTLVSIGTLHEFVSKTGAPLRSKRSRLRQRLQLQPSSILAADHHRKSVVKSKRWSHAEAELFIALLYAPINLLLIAAWLLFENRRQRRARVFRVDVDSSGENRLLADECASKIKATLHQQMSSSFDDLREKFSEDELLGEVLRPNHNAIRITFTTYERQEKQDDKRQQK